MGELSIEKLAVDVAKVGAQVREHEHRFDEIEKRQTSLEDLTASVKVLATRQETSEADIKEIKADVKSIKDVPGKRWNSIVEKIIMLVVAALVGYLLKSVGL